VSEAHSEIAHLSPVQRAAVLLLTIGEADAAEVLKHMDPREVQVVGQSMASLHSLKNEEIGGVLAFFLETVGGQSGLALGARDYVRTMITSALGEDRAKALLDRILGGSTSGLEKLKWMDARGVHEFLRFEHPQIQAIVLSYLEADQAAKVLELFQNDAVRADVMMRIASLESVPPTALQELNAVVEQQFAGRSSSRFAQLGGVKVAAEILNRLDGSLGTKVIEDIKAEDEVTSERIQDQMFVFGDLAEVDDRGIQTLLREVASDNLILALKGADEDLKQKIFGNMSKRAAELLRDDLEAKGPVRVSDVQAAQKEIVAVARRLAEAGQINLGGSGKDEMI
jgi:flagellar motor switch protein FliG